MRTGTQSASLGSLNVSFSLVVAVFTGLSQIILGFVHIDSQAFFFCIHLEIARGALASVVQLVGMPFCALKGLGLDSLSGHEPTWLIHFPVRAHVGGDQWIFFLSH